MEKPEYPENIYISIGGGSQDNFLWASYQQQPEGYPLWDEYTHSRIVEALRRENEELRDKLKPHPKCDKSCMFLCEGDAKLMKSENEELQAKMDKAKDALRFYADNWKLSDSLDEVPNYQLIIDEGQRARTTLEELE